MRNDVIYLIGPGGAGKSTAGALLARELGYSLIDLDEYFVAHSGDISTYLWSHTYCEYATRNFMNYRVARKPFLRQLCLFFPLDSWSIRPRLIRPTQGCETQWKWTRSPSS